MISVVSRNMTEMAKKAERKANQFLVYVSMRIHMVDIVTMFDDQKVDN